MTLNIEVVGETSSVRQLADSLRQLGAGVEDTATGWHRARGTAEGVWEGQASESFQQLADRTGKDGDELAGNESKATGYQMTGNRPSTGGMVVGVLFLLLGAGWWVTYVQQTSSGYKTGALDTPFIVLGFALWFIPWFIGTITSVIASTRRRKITSLVVFPLGFILLIVAIVTTATGAEPTPGGPGVH